MEWLLYFAMQVNQWMGAVPWQAIQVSAHGECTRVLWHKTQTDKLWHQQKELGCYKAGYSDHGGRELQTAAEDSSIVVHKQCGCMAKPKLRAAAWT